MTMQNQLPLLLRVFVLYPIAGLAAAFPSVDFDKAAGILTVDLNDLSIEAGVAIYALVSGGTYAWSRLMASRGGAT